MPHRRVARVIVDVRPPRLRLREPVPALDRQFRTSGRSTCLDAASLFDRRLLIEWHLPDGRHRLRGIRRDIRLLQPGSRCSRRSPPKPDRTAWPGTAPRSSCAREASLGETQRVPARAVTGPRNAASFLYRFLRLVARRVDNQADSAARALNGRMSVQLTLIHSRQTSRVPGGPTARQPSGTHSKWALSLAAGRKNNG
ncbi:hypothetical protein EMIT0158MI4_170033 [Burkholderia ambifaria]